MPIWHYKQRKIVKKVNKFYKSRRQFAVDLSSFKVRSYYPSRYINGEEVQDKQLSYSATVNVLYFKKKDGVLAVYKGVLWDYFGNIKPKDVMEFLELCNTRRYGPRVIVKWDGKGIWGIDNLEDAIEYKKELDPILSSYPEVPSKYDTWWEF